MNACRKILLLLCLGLSGMSLWAQNTDRVDFVVRRITRRQDVKHAAFSVCIHNITKDSLVYARNENLAVMPAAINKLFTSAAAYKHLGPKFTFENYLYYSGNIDNQGTLNGDLIIVGSGDPFFCSDRFPHTDSTFHRLAANMRKLGIRKVSGRVYVDTTLYEDEMMHPSWQWSDIGNALGSGACGLNYNENSVDVHVRAGRRVGDPAIITSISPEIKIANHLTTGSRDTSFSVTFFGSPYEDGRICRGVVPLGTADTHFRASLPHPALFMGKAFTQYLRSHGIYVTGEPSTDFEMPKQIKKICIDTSFNLFTITALTTQTNSTLAAESLFKLLGYIRDGHGCYESGRKSLYDYFKELNLNTKDVKMVDGSGLSRNNYVSAYFVTQFLDAVARQPFFWDFASALGISQKMPEYAVIPDIPGGCSLKVKSGIMPGVRNFVGYFTNDDDEMFSFAIMCNNYDCDDLTMDSLIRNIIEEIVKM